MGMPPVPDLPGASLAGAAAASGPQAKAEQDARWIGDFTDDLSVAIALRKWTEAIDLIDQGRHPFVCYLFHSTSSTN